MTRHLRILLSGIALALAASPAFAQTISVVDMVPGSASGETNDDSEPNLAVNPANPLQLVATAFTPDPMGTAGVAPIYRSADGGSTWELDSILSIPTSNNCVGNSTCDITPRFAQTSGNLYLSWLTADASLNIPLIVARSQPFPGPPGTPTNLQTISSSYPDIIDQPFVQAWTALSGGNAGNDRVYVGENDLRGGTGGHTAGLDASQAAEGAPPAGFGTPQQIEVRTTCQQDGPPIRPAVHQTGVVYAAFYSWTSCSGSITADVVVVRDDNWGAGGSPYQALKDSDAKAGKRVVTGVSLPPCNSSVGNQRICGALSIAVDPNNNQQVWIAWADGTSGSNYTLHVRASSDGGATWGSDLKTVVPAINPALAITTDSKVGLLYQKLVSPGTCTGGSPCWETHLETTTHGSSWTNFTLANTPDTLTSSINNVLGDYEYLAAVGKNFYGIFSTNNLPNSTNFPQGVTYQRFADATGAHQLYADAGHTTTVSASVDPFFFSASNVPAGEDYYVRDWTESATSHDNGEEPSTNPVWWTTSDVWNRLTDTAGAFNGNDQPAHEVAQDASSGHNFAFVRVHRKAAGSASEQVSASFLFADYGLGVPYEYVTGSPLSSTAALTFAAADTVQSIADGSGVQWDLPAERSTHICMAVEIAGPHDPYSPELVGRAPGWPTDQLITTDNNKAQINMDLPPVPQGGGQFRFWGLVHNAALYTRDMHVRYRVDPQTLRRIEGSSIIAVGARGGPVRDEGTVTFTGMRPGESRWIGVNFRTNGAKPGDVLPVTFEETEGSSVLNAFTVSPRVGDLTDVIASNLRLHRATFHRLAKGFGISRARDEYEAVAKQRDGRLSESEYVKFVATHAKAMREIAAALGARFDGAREFGIDEALSELSAAAAGGNVPLLASAHASFLEALDTAATAVQKHEGDPVDFLQMVLWQESLFRTLDHAKDAERIVAESNAFVDAVDGKKAGVADYPALLKRLLPSFEAAVGSLGKDSGDVRERLASLRKALGGKGNVRAIEGRHREFLDAVSAVVPARYADADSGASPGEVRLAQAPR